MLTTVKEYLAKQARKPSGISAGRFNKKEPGDGVYTSKPSSLLVIIAPYLSQYPAP